MTTDRSDDDATVLPFRAGGRLDQGDAEAAEADAPETAGGGGEKPPKSPQSRAVGDDDGQRRAAIIPAPLGRGQIRQTAVDFVSLQGYRAGFHGFRSPVYAVGSIGYAGRGVHRLGTRWGTWVAAPHLHMLVSEAVARGQSGHAQAMHAHAEGRRTRKARWQITGAVAAAAGTSALIVDQWAPGLVQDLLAAGAFGVLVHQGRPVGRPMLPAAILPPQYQVPTPELITEAFRSLGISAIVRYIEKNGTLDWVSDVHRDGPGWAVELDLPGGVKAETIVAKRKELSSALKRPLSAVWPEGVPGEHEGRVYLWIGRQDMAKMKAPAWPLLKSGTADYFQPAPFAFTPRAITVYEKLFGKNWLVGGAPGNGKTSVIRVLASWAALDPTVQLWVHELLGKGDLDPFTQVAHRYCSGLDPDSLAYAAESITMLKREVARRVAILKKIPLTERPDGDITREIAAKYGLYPIVAVFDEIHNLFLDEKLGPQAAKDIIHVIRSARALGITVVAATQRPDKDAMPTGMSGVVTTRFCLKVPDWQSNNMILGTGAHDAGWSAVDFRQETDAGLGWLRGTGDPRPVKTYYLNLPATQKICARARALREAAGTLSGYALGEDGDGERSLIGDVQSVFAQGEKFLYWPTVADRLGQSFPGTYAGVTPKAVSADVRAITGREGDEGREPGGANLSGIKLTTIEATLSGMAAAPEPDADDLDTELLIAAAEFIVTAKFCTSAMLQRKFRTGSAETGALLTRLEEFGIIAAPTDGEKARNVLKRPDELDEALQRIREAVSV